MPRGGWWLLVALVSCTTFAALAGTVTAAAPPVAHPGGPYAGVLNAPLTFNGGDSTGLNLSFVWDFGDGTRQSGVIVEKRYGSAGVFEVTLTVTDWEGRSATARTIAAIGIAGAPFISLAGPCVASLGPTGVYCGAFPGSCTLTAYGTVCWAIPSDPLVAPYYRWWR